MADQVIPNPNRIFDANGVPVAGGTVSVFLTGTSTRAAIWTDATGATALPNPITADGNGYFAQFFTEDTVRLLVKDAADAVLYDIDPAPSVINPSLDAATVSFTATADIPFSDVQAAVEGVDTNWRAAVAAVGIGGTGSPALDDDLDDGTAASGFTYFNATTLGTAPSGLALSSGGTVARYREDASNLRQVITGNSPTRWWVRDLKDGTWTQWVESAVIPQNVARGDILYRNATNLARLPIGTAKQVLRVKDDTFQPEWSDGWFEVATGQTITTGGTLTLPHGLAQRPRAISAQLTCTTAESGFSIGDVIMIDILNNTTGTSRNNTVILTTTNVAITFSNVANVFTSANPGTGAAVSLTNANWTLAVYASL